MKTTQLSITVASILFVLPWTTVAQEAGLVQSSFAYVFDAVATGALGQVGSDLTGWALGALGISSSNPEEQMEQELQAIEGELQDIEDTLNLVLNELEEIDQTLVQNDCNTLNAETLSAKSLIDSLYLDYQTFVKTAKGGVMPNIYCKAAATSPADCLVEWAKAVLDDSNEGSGVSNALSLISEALLDDGNAQGIIRACIDPTILPIPSVGDFDGGYYSKVLGLVNYYYYYQAIGFMMIAEAEHFDAWINANKPGGSPLNATVYSDICKSQGNVNCNGIVTSGNQLYENLIEQFGISGVPYSDNNVVLNYATATVRSYLQCIAHLPLSIHLD